MKRIEPKEVILRIIENHRSRLNFNHNAGRAVTLLLIACNHCNLLEGTRKEKLETLQEWDIFSGNTRSMTQSVTKFLLEHRLDEFYFDEEEYDKKKEKIFADQLAFSTIDPEVGKKTAEQKGKLVRRRVEKQCSEVSSVLKSMIATAMSYQNNESIAS